MHIIGNTPVAEIMLSWDHPVNGPASVRAKQLRGAIGREMIDNDLFHQHQNDSGKLIYRYPRVQYRWHRGHGLIIGWGDASMQLLSLPWLDLKELFFRDVVVSIVDIKMNLRDAVFGVGESLHEYHLKSPVLLLNQENYQRYRFMSGSEQSKERNRLVVANLLTAMRGLNIEFPERLFATFVGVQSRMINYKHKSLLGMSGKIITNAVLPDGFSFGHAVSHGFGWLVPE